MKKITIYEMTCCAIFAALLCILSPLSIPVGPIPVSLCSLVLYFAVIMLGTRGALISCIVYILLGLVGLPVFSGFSGGVAKVAGPTGGYILGYIFLVIIAGLFYRNGKSKKWLTIVGMIVATLVLYLFGTIWFVVLMKCTVAYALTACVLPFIGFDLIKIILAVFIGGVIRGALIKANLIPETFLQ